MTKIVLVNKFILFSVLQITAAENRTFKYYELISDIAFLNYAEDFVDNIYETYVYGYCQAEGITLVEAFHFRAYHLAARTIIYVSLGEVRKFTESFEWFPPSCVLMFAGAEPLEMISYDSTEQYMCIVQIIYTYSKDFWEYNYLEWYIPIGAPMNVNWHLLIYYNQTKDTDKIQLTGDKRKRSVANKRNKNKWLLT